MCLSADSFLLENCGSQSLLLLSEENIYVSTYVWESDIEGYDKWRDSDMRTPCICNSDSILMLQYKCSLKIIYTIK